MLWTIFAILLVLWLLGWGFHVAGSMIHLLLVVVVGMLLILLLLTPLLPQRLASLVRFKVARLMCSNPRRVLRILVAMRM